MYSRTMTAALAAAFLVPSASQSATIDVLWLTGDDGYNAGISELADSAGSFDPLGDGALDWDLTFWDGTSDPGFGDYDVFVVGSTCNYSTSGNCGGSNGFYGNGSYAGAVINYSAEIAAARGSRTFLSGQDADYHHLNNVPDRADGPMGFIINAVNWAASGTDLGIVSMTDRIGGNDGWWTADGSFLEAELAGTAFAYASETVNIGAGQESFPVNEGLTSAGLSNWNTSSHACFTEVSGYDRINFAPRGGGLCGVTIVTAGLADGGTDGGDDDDLPPVPLPAAGWLLLTALGAGVALRRKG